ncbi:MAG: helix-turn-helix domain-containing protein [Christensenellales bacterium]
MISGKKSRKLRLLRNLTQKVLAIKSRLTDAAIRNYELGNRSLSREQLEKIAEALGCDSFALLDHNLTTNFDFFQILFDSEDSQKLRPLVEEGTVALISHSPELNNLIIEWDEMRKKHYNGEITDDELRDWKLSYPYKSGFLRKRK